MLSLLPKTTALFLSFCLPLHPSIFFPRHKRWYQCNGRHSLQGQHCLTDDKRSQNGRIICPVAVGMNAYISFLFFILFQLFNFTSLLVRAEQLKKPPDYLWHWLEVLPGLFQKAKKRGGGWGGWRGGVSGGGGVNKWTKRESFQKICTYRVSVSGSRLGKRWGFSIMDKLLIRWELGLFLCPPPIPHPPHPPSLPPSLPSSATPLICFPSKMCLIFSDWTATSEMPKRTWRPCVDRTQLFI